MPEVASSCTTLTFEGETELSARDVNDTITIPPVDRIEVAVKSVNQW